jgi:hypothetical protein
MSGKDDSSSVFTIGATSRALEKTESQKVPHNSRKSKGKSARATQTDIRKQLAELKVSHRKEIQALKSKHRVEHKLVQGALRDQFKKSKVAVKEAKEGSKKFYDIQLRQLRSDFTNQNETLRLELKKFLEGSVEEVANNYEMRLANESNERLDNLRSMIHDDFVEAMQRKEDEIDQIRGESQAEIARVTQESTDKGHRITQLEKRMKEISHHLPDDVKKDIYEQFGFKTELEALQEKPKEKRKGFLARLRSGR